MGTTIYNNRQQVLEVAEFISNNRTKSYIGTKGNNTYYNVNGIVWEVWQDDCGNYPTTNGVNVGELENMNTTNQKN